MGLVLSAVSPASMALLAIAPLTADIPVHILNASNVLVSLLCLKLHSHHLRYYDLEILSREPAPAVGTLSSLPGFPLKPMWKSP